VEFKGGWYDYIKVKQIKGFKLFHSKEVDAGSMDDPKEK